MRIKLSQFQQKLLFLVLLACLTFPPRIIHLDQFLGPDEMAQWSRANNFYLALVDQDWAGTHLRDDTGNLTLMWLRAATVAAYHVYQQGLGSSNTMRESISTDRALEQLDEVRLVVAVANGFLILLTFHWVAILWGNRVGFIAALLLALDPFFLSESRMIRSEALYTAFMGLSVITLLLYLKGHQRAIWMSGVLGGLAISSKLTGLFLVGFVPLALLMQYSRSRNWLGFSKKWLYVTFSWLLSYIMTMVVLWPALWVRPVAIFYSMLRTINDSGIEGKEDFRFFLGRLWDNLPTYYYLVVIPFRTTPLVWIGLLIIGFAVGYRLYGQIRYKRAFTWDRQLFVLVVFAVFYAVCFSVAANKTDRYILSTIWALNVVASVGLAYGLDWLSKVTASWQFQISQTIWGVGLIGVVVGASYVIFTVHPYYTAYYNPLLGGHWQAEKNLPLGYGAGVKQAMVYLNQQPNPEKLQLVCGTNEPRCALPFLGETWQRRTFNPVDGRWVLADYILIYIEQQQRQMYPSGIVAYLQQHAPVYVAQVNGLDYAWVYKAPNLSFSGQATNLAGLGTLLGYEVNVPSDVASGDTISVTAMWHNEQIFTKSMHAQIVDPAGYVWTESQLTPMSTSMDDLTIDDSVIEATGDITLPSGMLPGRYFLRLGFRRTDQQPELFLPFELPLSESENLTINQIDQKAVDLSTIEYPLDYAMTDHLRLLGTDLAEQAVPAGERFWLPLLWQATADMTQDYVILIRLLDEQETEVAYWLGRPVQSSQTTREWQAKQVVRDVWDLTIPADIKTSQYQFELALFDAHTQVEVNRLRLQSINVVQ